MLVLIGDSKMKKCTGLVFYFMVLACVCCDFCEHTHSFACNGAELAAGAGGAQPLDPWLGPP